MPDERGAIKKMTDTAGLTSKMEQTIERPQDEEVKKGILRELKEEAMENNYFKFRLHCCGNVMKEMKVRTGHMLNFWDAIGHGLGWN